jgi:hypothetical protein
VVLGEGKVCLLETAGLGLDDVAVVGVGNGLNLGSFELERARCGDEAEIEGFGRRVDRGLIGGGTEGMSTSSDSIVPDIMPGMRFQSSRSSTGAMSAMRFRSTHVWCTQ